jgi:serine phosphatase RsbU (regulator of sigma subunit)
MTDTESQLPSGAPSVTPYVVDGQHTGRPAAERSSVRTETPTETLDRERLEFARLRQITARVNRGMHLDEVLQFIYQECRDIIPYHRIAFATIDTDRRRITARWSRTDGMPKFPVGHWSPFAGSSLMDVASRGRPRIINDLAAYAKEHPESDVTRMLVEEGLRSSLTCPLVIEGRAVGFLFFDHQDVGIYSQVHVAFFVQIADIVASGIERARIFSEVSEQKEIIERQNVQLAEENRRNQLELEMARKVQLALIPQQLPETPEVEMAMLYEPAELVGGDLLDVIPLEKGRLLVYMADAMGHGVPAALLMSVVRTAFHTSVRQAERSAALSPGQVLRGVNRTVIELFKSNFVTAVCALLDIAADTATFSVAGHPPVLIRRAASSEIDVIAQGEIPLGIDNETEYADMVVSFSPGDTLLMYTDGVIEAPDQEHGRYGLESLKAFFASTGQVSAQETVDRLRESLDHYCSCDTLEDDLAVLAVRRPAKT